MPAVVRPGRADRHERHPVERRRRRAQPSTAVAHPRRRRRCARRTQHPVVRVSGRRLARDLQRTAGGGSADDRQRRHVRPDPGGDGRRPGTRVAGREGAGGRGRPWCGARLVRPHARSRTSVEVAALGPGAAIATTGTEGIPIGSVEPLSPDPELARGPGRRRGRGRPTCSSSTSAACGRHRSPSVARPEQIRLVDDRIDAVLRGLPPTATVLVASLADDGETPHLQVRRRDRAGHRRRVRRRAARVPIDPAGRAWCRRPTWRRPC